MFFEKYFEEIFGNCFKKYNKLFSRRTSQSRPPPCTARVHSQVHFQERVLVGGCERGGGAVTRRVHEDRGRSAGWRGHEKRLGPHRGPLRAGLRASVHLAWALGLLDRWGRNRRRLGRVLHDGLGVRGRHCTCIAFLHPLFVLS